MTKPTGKAALVGVIGSAAIAAAVLYANSRRGNQPKQPGPVPPPGPKPETD